MATKVTRDVGCGGGPNYEDQQAGLQCTTASGKQMSTALQQNQVCSTKMTD